MTMLVLKPVPPECMYGTSFHGDYVWATYNQLVAVLGPPIELGSADGKVNVTWVLEFYGHVVTLYDWKQASNPEHNQEQGYEWHIGAASSQVSIGFLRYLHDGEVLTK